MALRETERRHEALRRSVPYTQVLFGFPGAYFLSLHLLTVYILFAPIIQISDILFVRTGT